MKQLQIDFPDLTVSKVRYLEDRGLVEPTRTSSGYRKYSAEDIRTLRHVLSMQRDQYLPLEVIRRRLGEGSADAPATDTDTSLDLSMSPTQSLAPEEPIYTLEDLARLAGVQEMFLRELVEFRLLDPRAEEGPAFTETDLHTARVARRLARHRLEPRNLRILSSAAEREAALIEQVAAPALRSGHGDRREYGLETVRELGALFSQLNQLLLKRELRRIR